MFGFAFGFTFFVILSILSGIADKIGAGSKSTISDSQVFVVALVLSVAVGIMAQCGLVSAIKKYSKY